MEKVSKEKIKEVVWNLIYHGRHFSGSRDEVVARKSIDYIMSIIEEEKEKAESDYIHRAAKAIELGR